MDDAGVAADDDEISDVVGDQRYDFKRVAGGGLSLRLNPYGYCWLRLDSAPQPEN